MSDVNSPGASPIIKDFAEGFSAQSKLSNRLWITLATLIIVVLLPDPLDSSTEPIRDLPFGIGPVDPKLFDMTSFFMMAVLTVAFCQAQAQAMRAYRAAHQFIDKMGEKKPELVRRERLFLDVLSIPTLSRVGSLPVLILSMFPENQRPPLLYWLASIYYLLLKILSISIHLGLPGIALYFTWERLQSYESLPFLVLYGGPAIGAVTFLALLQIFLLDFFGFVRTACLIAKGDV